MYEEDRLYAMEMYERMFDIAEDDEQGLIQHLMSPTRQAVVIARAYNAKERKLSVESQSKDDDYLEEDGTPPYAQVRMAALIRKIGIKRPDPDNGKTYDRLLVPPDKAAFLLNWGDVGRQQLLAAQQAIYPLYNITEPTSSEEWV